MPDKPTAEANAPESGGALREQLEKTLEKVSELTKANRELAAQNVIISGGHTYVKPTDLLEVPVDELAAKAAEINQARAAEREQIFREMAQAKGLKLEDDTTVTVETDPVIDPSIVRVASLGTLGGTPPGAVKPQPKTAEDMIAQGLFE